jgi:F-type H+-transporting ATPase subunit b
VKRLKYVFGITLLLLVSWFAVAQSSTSGQNTNPSAPPPKTAPKNSENQSSASGKHEGLGRELSEESKQAAGEEAENAEFKESPSVQFIARHLGISVFTVYWILIILNFAIVAGAIVWFWRSKMPSAFRARTESILKSMETARQASEDANHRLKDVEARLARLDSEIEKMKSAADAAAHDEELRIQQAIEDDKKKIIESAEQEIDAAARAARAQLKSFAAELAVGLAEKQIRIDPNTDQALVRGFGKQLSESARNGKENG